MEHTADLRNMAGIYLLNNNKILLLYRQGSKVANNTWIASAGGHFEEWELNDAKACALREMQEELSVTEEMISDIKLRYITLRRTNQNDKVYVGTADGTGVEFIELAEY